MSDSFLATCALLAVLSLAVEVFVLYKCGSGSLSRCVLVTLVTWLPGALLMGASLAWAAANAVLVGWTLLTGLPILAALLVMAVSVFLKVLCLWLSNRSWRGLMIAHVAVIAALAAPITTVMMWPHTAGLEESVVKQDLPAVEKAAAQQPDGWTQALLMAARHRSPKVAALALQHGVSADATDSAQITALGYLGVPVIANQKEMPAEREEMIRLLVDKGADLKLAAQQLVLDASPASIRLVIDKGAPLRDEASGACPALFILARRKRPDVGEILALFVAHKADVNRPWSTASPLLNAINSESQDLAVGLIEAGASCEAVEGQDVPLVEASWRKQSRVVSALLAKGVDVEAVGPQGYTAWRATSDAAIRRDLEAHGARPSCPDVVISSQQLESAYTFNTSPARAGQYVQSQLPGQPPYNLTLDSQSYPKVQHIIFLRLVEGGRNEVVREWGLPQPGLKQASHDVLFGSKPVLRLEWSYPK